MTHTETWSEHESPGGADLRLLLLGARAELEDWARAHIRQAPLAALGVAFASAAVVTLLVPLAWQIAAVPPAVRFGMSSWLDKLHPAIDRLAEAVRGATP
jgi:hypothetical protein